MEISSKRIRALSYQYRTVLSYSTDLVKWSPGNITYKLSSFDVANVEYEIFHDEKFPNILI